MKDTLYVSEETHEITCLNERFFIRYTADLVPEAPEKNLHYVELEDEKGACIDAEYLNPRTMKIVSDEDSSLPAPVPLLFFEYLLENPELRNLLEEEYDCGPERADRYSDAFRTEWVNAANRKIQEISDRVANPEEKQKAIVEYLGAKPLLDASN